MTVSENALIVLGSSSGLPQAERASAGYLLKAGQKLSLIDCGGGVTSSFLKRGFDPLEVRRVFISHTHPDHCCELPLFIQLLYLSDREEALDIFVPFEFAEPFRSYMNATYMIAEKLPFEIRLTGYDDGFNFKEDITVTAVANNHLKGYADLIEKLALPNRMQCHGFSIGIGDRTIFYSADVADLDDVRDHLDGHSVVIIESTHIDMEEFFEYAQEILVEQYIISHLGTEEEVRHIKILGRKYGLDNVVIAEDGMVLRL